MFIGDGMGLSTTNAARIYKGQSQGNTGEETILEFEKFPYAAFSKVKFDNDLSYFVHCNFLDIFSYDRQTLY
jgi:alkaline phosphatase